MLRAVLSYAARIQFYRGGITDNSLEGRATLQLLKLFPSDTKLKLGNSARKSADASGMTMPYW